MSEEINLLPEISEEEIKTGTYRRKINVTVIIALLVAMAIFAVLVGYWLFLGITVKQIAKQTEEAEQNILQGDQKEITHRSLSAKLDEAKTFLSESLPFSISLDKLEPVLKDAGVTLTEGKFSNDGRITITGEAPTVDSFARLVAGLNAKALTETFHPVTLHSL